MLQSSVAWIDFAEEDRRRMTEVISLFGERDTRDELGLGSVRDAFANLFFPGTSTLQTRARYSLFVPWTYRYFEQRTFRSHKIERRLKNCEIRTINLGYSSTFAHESIEPPPGTTRATPE